MAIFDTTWFPTNLSPSRLCAAARQDMCGSTRVVSGTKCGMAETLNSSRSYKDVRLEILERAGGIHITFTSRTL